MTLKQQIHDLVDELPDNSPVLVEVREALRMNHAIGEAMEDVRNGRTYGEEDFMARVQERWPRKIPNPLEIILTQKRERLRQLNLTALPSLSSSRNC